MSNVIECQWVWNQRCVMKYVKPFFVDRSEDLWRISTSLWFVFICGNAPCNATRNATCIATWWCYQCRRGPNGISILVGRCSAQELLSGTGGKPIENRRGSDSLTIFNEEFELKSLLREWRLLEILAQRWPKVAGPNEDEQAIHFWLGQLKTLKLPSGIVGLLEWTEIYFRFISIEHFEVFASGTWYFRWHPWNDSF